MKMKMVVAGMVLGLFVVSGIVSSAAQAPGNELGGGASLGDRVRAASGTHRALLVGINEYDPAYGASPLGSCVNDVMGVRNMILLADPAQRWSASRIQLLTNNLATSQAIRSAWQSLATASQPGDLVLYAHSSHGGQYSGTSVYLCAYDQDYSAVSLGQDLAQINPGVTVVVLVDACHSGGLYKQNSGWPFAEMTLQSYRETQAQKYRAKGLAVPKDLGNNIAFMTACTYAQTCLSGSPYSLYIGSVITGCLDPAVDTNHDGLYQFSELHAYAAQIATQQNPNQTAQQFHETVLTSSAARSVGNVVGPVIMANGMTNDITISQSDNLAITVQLIPGPYTGELVDWWVVAQAGGSSWYFLNSAGSWPQFDGNLSNCRPAFSGALVNLPATLVLDKAAINLSMPAGVYTFWFAITYPMSGILNPNGQILFTQVNVTVQ